LRADIKETTSCWTVSLNSRDDLDVLFPVEDVVDQFVEDDFLKEKNNRNIKVNISLLLITDHVASCILTPD